MVKVVERTLVANREPVAQAAKVAKVVLVVWLVTTAQAVLLAWVVKASEIAEWAVPEAARTGPPAYAGPVRVRVHVLRRQCREDAGPGQAGGGTTRR